MLGHSVEKLIDQQNFITKQFKAALLVQSECKEQSESKSDLQTTSSIQPSSSEETREGNNMCSRVGY